MSFIGTTDTDFVKLLQYRDDKKSDIIDYSISDFYSIRTKLIEYIKAVYPQDYTNFNDSDLGMMFIELVSYMGAVMSHKADMLANESFLSTVKNKGNLLKLLELIGGTMRGPSSAVGAAKVTFTPAVSPTTDITYTILAQDRVISVPSEVDGSIVSYTLYPTSGGVISADIDGDADIGFIIPSGTNAAINENLVLIEGALVYETGLFEDTELFKSISLSKSSVIDSSISIFVNSSTPAENGVYKEVKNLFLASGASDKVFITKGPPGNRASIIFGDNVFGISPSKDSTFSVVYRVGGGSIGNRQKETINAPISMSRAYNAITGEVVQGTLENNGVITGGTEEESMIHAKTYAAANFARQNRVVTLEDYISFINTIDTTPGIIGKATVVTRKAFSSANIIDVYVVEKASNFQLQRATTVTKQKILTELNKVKMITDQVSINDGLIRTLDLNITVSIESEHAFNKNNIKLNVANRIMSYFNVDRFGFGEPFIKGKLNKFIYQTPGVRFSSVDNVPDEIQVDFNEIIQLNNFTINIVEA